MASYYINEAVIELPERTFVDKTIHGLEYKLPGGKTLCVFVHRRRIEEPKSLRQLVDDNIALNKRRLLGFVAIDETETRVGGLPGIQVRARWRDQGTVFYQRQAHVVFEEQLMIVAVSAPLDEQAICDETFDEIAASITWRTD
jgi:hypothetical protein